MSLLWTLALCLPYLLLGAVVAWVVARPGSAVLPWGYHEVPEGIAWGIGAAALLWMCRAPRVAVGLALLLAFMQSW